VNLVYYVSTWWKEIQIRIPILAKVAKDYLAIPGSSVYLKEVSHIV